MEAPGIPVDTLNSLLEAVSTSSWTLALKTFQDPTLASEPGLWTSEVLQKMALLVAVAGGSTMEFVKDLVNFVPQASLERPDEFGRTALHVAVVAGNTEAAKILVKKSPTLARRMDNKNELPIHLAARHAHKETVRFLLSVTDNKDPEGAISAEAGARLLKLLIIADFYDIALEVLKRCLAQLSPLPSSPSQLLDELCDLPLCDLPTRLSWMLEDLARHAFSDLPPSLSRLLVEATHLSLSDLPRRLSRLLEDLAHHSLSHLVRLLLEKLDDPSLPERPLSDLPRLLSEKLRLLLEKLDAERPLSDLRRLLSEKLRLLLEKLADRSLPDLPRLSHLRLLLEEPLEMLATRPEAFARRHHRPRFCLSAPHHFLRNSLLYMKGTRQFGIPHSTDCADFKNPHAIDLLRHLIREILERQKGSAAEVLGRQLCTAAELGNYEAVAEILRANPILLGFRNIDGHGFLELAVLKRQERVFNLVYQLGPLQHIKDSVLQTKDDEGNNIFHLAARPQPSSASNAALQVQRDLQWFKEIEMNVQPSFKKQKNNAGKTPREVFAESHAKLLEEGDKWMKKTAESCTVVAALVVTVVFAAAFTVPGGNNDSNGIPHYLTDASFMTFAISDTLGLVSSTTSLLMFLSILSSRFSRRYLLNTGQYKRLLIGLVTLFFSIASMLVTFTASLHIALGHRVKWIAVPIGILASVPVILFALLQFPLLVEIFYSTLRPFFFPGGKVRYYWTFRQIFCS